MRMSQVVVTIGQAEPALQEEWRITARVVQVLCDPETEQLVGVETPSIERIDVSPQLAAEKATTGFCAR